MRRPDSLAKFPASEERAGECRDFGHFCRTRMLCSCAECEGAACEQKALRKWPAGLLTFLENGALSAGHVQAEGGFSSFRREAQEPRLVGVGEHHGGRDLVPLSPQECFDGADDHCRWDIGERVRGWH